MIELPGCQRGECSPRKCKWNCACFISRQAQEEQEKEQEEEEEEAETVAKQQRSGSSERQPESLRI